MRGEAGEGRDEMVEVPDGVLNVGCGCVGFFAWGGGVARCEERGVETGVDFIEGLAEGEEVGFCDGLVVGGVEEGFICDGGSVLVVR
jgi:hypothetical protein